MKSQDLLSKIEYLKTCLINLGLKQYDENVSCLDIVKSLVTNTIATTGLEEGCYVRLRKDYTFSQYFENRQVHGWWYARKTFVKGAVGRIETLDMSPNGKVYAYVRFYRCIHEDTFKKETFRATKNDALWLFDYKIFERITIEEAEKWVQEFDNTNFAPLYLGDGI